MSGLAWFLIIFGIIFLTYYYLPRLLKWFVKKKLNDYMSKMNKGNKQSSDFFGSATFNNNDNNKQEKKYNKTNSKSNKKDMYFMGGIRREKMFTRDEGEYVPYDEEIENDSEIND